MTTLHQPSRHDDDSQAHHDDAMTFLTAMREAGSALAATAGMAPSADPATAARQRANLTYATVLYQQARDEAYLHAQLAAAAAARDQAAAVRELTTEVDALRRLLP